MLTALALNATIKPVSYFDRKHYFYYDLPVRLVASVMVERVYIINISVRQGWLSINTAAPTFGGGWLFGAQFC